MRSTPTPARSEALSDEAVRARADALIAQMTPQEKAGQITQYFDFLNAPEEAARVEQEVAAARAGSLLFVHDPAQLDRLQRIAVEQTRLKIPLLFGYDVIHGLRTILPVPIAIAASWDPLLAEQGQRVAAREARAVGIHWTFAPNVDIARDPRWGRMIEGAGEDPYLGSVMAAAQVRGFQGTHIGSPGRLIAGPKHFAGYGASIGGRDYDEVNLSDSELWNVYLPPFKAAVDAGAGNIMSAYMGLNGVPATGSHWLLTQVLRETWGFKGFVVTDAGSAHDLHTHEFASSVPDAGVRALRAGVDMEMAPPFGISAFQTLPQSLAEGRLSTTELDDAVRRVLEAKIRMGLFEQPYVDLDEAQRVLNDPEHRDVARVAAERTAVLLRNDGGVLPLDARALKSIAVIGPLADSARDTVGPWVFDQDDSETVTLLDGIRARAGSGVRIEYSPGVTMPARLHRSIFDSGPHKAGPRVEVDDDAEILRAVELARAADVAVLVLGEGQIMIGEHASRSSLDLPGRQQDLLDAVIATGQPVVVLLMSARPLDLKGSQPDALMGIWYPGSQGGAAVARLLFGDVSPGGKLPFNWPRNIGQIPLPYAHLRTHQPKTAEERYWNEPNSPLYPFGFGLSYSSFEFSNLQLDRSEVAVGEAIRVSVDVSNTGGREADEVAQLYIHQRHGTAARPVRELKGFERLTLAPGERRTVSFTLKPQDLTYWAASTRNFVQDATVIDVYVGGSSTAALSGSFEVR
ncbi:glycoside hydrolase family 3 N-terminal domain-containing protein [Roseateles asaccharophilus]|uniref:beta-glucosidase n=1 Tax=Roseateles asaccharophilus TaxID=582607 RepID=A0ABU2ACK1_9BURK|nr:glycoside hydrolase family 3 N-terminal domain-containing protein [Roseateles asaccharophilus]MDR7334936.1 beta-glucosidase [Roseateles asaccharophilus]